MCNQTEIDKQVVLEKEIDLIQSCVSRMAQNSFMVKGWLITIIAVVLALLPESVDIRVLCIIGAIVTGCFWYLDGFFLKMEKLYRWKYEWIIKKRYTSEEFFYDLNPYNDKMRNKDIDKDGNEKDKKEPIILRVMFTKTLIPMYLPIVLGIVLVFVNTFTKWF